MFNYIKTWIIADFPLSHLFFKFCFSSFSTIYTLLTSWTLFQTVRSVYVNHVSRKLVWMISLTTSFLPTFKCLTNPTHPYSWAKNHGTEQPTTTLICSDYQQQQLCYIDNSVISVNAPVNLTKVLVKVTSHLWGRLLWHVDLPHRGFPRGGLFQKKRQPLASPGFGELHRVLPGLSLPPHRIQLPAGGGRKWTF